VLTTNPAVRGQQPLNFGAARDTSISSGFWVYEDIDAFALANTTRELRGQDTKVMIGRSGFGIDGNLIIKDGVGLEIPPGDSMLMISDNVKNASDVDTVVDISGPGSSLLSRDTDPGNQHFIDIGGSLFGQAARSLTVNVSNGGSFVFDYASNNTHRYIGDRTNTTLNV
jgi:hypothetical protein